MTSNSGLAKKSRREKGGDAAWSGLWPQIVEKVKIAEKRRRRRGCMVWPLTSNSG
jgi:hypothetical protein